MSSALAQALFTFGVMLSHDPIFITLPITEVPDHVWDSRYIGRNNTREKSFERLLDSARKIVYPNAESALKGAKKACRKQQGRWLGRESGSDGFCVYEGGKVIERHVVGR